jgi:phage gp29-like protein
MSKLGKLNACVRWWVYKTEIARIWAKYNQLMGIPPVIAKTLLKDKTRKENAITMLKNWLNSRWMVIDENDTVEGYSGSGTTSQLFFESLMRYCDEQISKALLNSTMVLDNGSSRSQGEVHEENTIRVINTLCQLGKFIINDDLLPRLQKIGFVIPKGSYFVWDNSEKMTMKEKAEIIQILSNAYKVPEKTASEFVGIELEEKEIEPISTPNFNKDKKQEKI